MVDWTAEVVVSMTGASACTVSCSVTPATASSKLMTASAPTVSVDPAADRAAEALHLGRDLVGPWRNGGDPETSFRIGHAGADEPGFNVLGGDGRARQRRSLRVGDGADDGGGFLLGDGCGRMQPEYCGQYRL